MEEDRLKKYKILKKIGKGSFGTVYKVKRIEDGQILALKYINIAKMD